MVILEYLDVDAFLTKEDFCLLKKSKKWPWKITHFILRTKCFQCQYSAVSTKPQHIIVLDYEIIYLLSFNCFWCENCNNQAIYDHYPSDECEFCDRV